MDPSNIGFLSFRVMFHFHDYGRKGSRKYDLLIFESVGSFFTCVNMFVCYDQQLVSQVPHFLC